MDDRCRHWRFRAHHHTRAAPAHKRLVCALLGYLSVSIDSVVGKKKSGNHAVGLDSFCHCLCYYHARPPGLEDRRARHIPDRPVTMLERRLLLISVARDRIHRLFLRPTSVALATVFTPSFVIRHSRHILLVPGTSSVEHLRENVAGCGLESSKWNERDRRQSDEGTAPFSPIRTVSDLPPALLRGDRISYRS
jgi:hypothetical protein